MQQRQALDVQASAIMFFMCMIWGLQQVILKMAAPDISTIMQIAIRSALSALMVYPFIHVATRQKLWSKEFLPAGILVGFFFTAEFYLVAEALTYTSAAHTVVLLYTAPIFVAFALHWKLPSERLSSLQWAGVLLAFLGIIVSFFFRNSTSSALHSDILWGDFLALLAGLFWAATTIGVRLSCLSEAPATQTLFYQLLIAGVSLLPVAWLSGRADIHWTAFSISSLIFHTLIVSFFSYLVWFWLLKKYLASRLGVFSFLTPIFGVLFGMILLGETLELSFIVGTAMVMFGVMLVSLQGWLKKSV